MGKLCKSEFVVFSRETFGGNKMRKTILAIATTFLILAVQTLSPTDTSAKIATDNLLICGGCKTEYFLIKRLAEAFNAETGRTSVLGCVGNKNALESLIKGKIDFAFTCSNIDTLATKLNLSDTVKKSLKSIPLAIEPIVVVGHADNAVSNLSLEQLAEVFQGKVKNWKELGGQDIPVKLAHIVPEMESGMLPLFKELTVGTKGTLARATKTTLDPNELGQYIRTNPGAITFMPLGFYNNTFGELLSINGTPPNQENILNGDYDLVVRYYLTLKTEDSPRVNEFVNFSLSDMGKKIASKNHISVEQ